MSHDFWGRQTLKSVKQIRHLRRARTKTKELPLWKRQLRGRKKPAVRIIVNKSEQNREKSKVPNSIIS